MRKRIFYFTAVVLMLGFCTVSCRDDSDEIQSYGQNDYLVFNEAGKSFAAQFKAVWTAMNSNYGMWDYEKSFGLDWDNVYEKYLPEFERLDREYDEENNPAPDEVVEKLYKEVFAPIHDGHFMAQVRNLHTREYIDISPSAMRHNLSKEESDFLNNFKPDVSKYVDGIDSLSVKYEKIGTDDKEKEADFLHASLQYDTLEIWNMYEIWEKSGDKEHMDYLENRLLPQVRLAQNCFKTKESPDVQISKYLAFLRTIKSILDDDLNKDDDDNRLYDPTTSAEEFNKERLDKNAEKMDVENFFARTALIKDGDGSIPYFTLSSFAMTGIVGEDFVSKITCPEMSYVKLRLLKVWRKWFDNIQTLSAEGKLKGVIVDMRSNCGGFDEDAQYVTGSLLQDNECMLGYYRFKTGPGRFDYAPMTPTYMIATKEKHVTVTQPIVCLTNTRTTSMAEATAKLISYLPNGYVVGTQTWGGLSGLSDGIESYSYTYASIVGKMKTTPFYLYIPNQATFDRNKQPMEGIGVVPRQENTLEFDKELFKKDKTDNQIELALKIIRGKA